MKKNVLAWAILVHIASYGQGLLEFPKEDSLLPQNNPDFDTNYVRSYPDYLSIALFTRAPSVQIDISQKKSEENVHAYKSNMTGVIGLDLDYKGISLVLGLQTKNDIKSVAQKGKTDYRFLSLKLHRHKYFASVNYIKSLSFFDKASHFNFPGSNREHPYILRPSLNYTQANITFLYNINHGRYSYLAPFAFTERQIKSKGGWLAAGGIYYNSLRDTHPLIEPTHKQSKDNDTLNRRLDTYFLKAGFGRGINIILYRRIYFNVQALLYGNLAYMNTFGNTQDKNSISPNLFAELSAGLGYNTERFFMGLRFTADRNTIRKNQFKYVNTNGFAQVNIGYRFNSPKWLDKSYDFVKRKIIKV